MPVHEVVLGDLLSFGATDGSNNNDNGENNEDDGGASQSLPASYCYPNCRTTENIRKWVLEDVATHSTSIYPN